MAGSEIPWTRGLGSRPSRFHNHSWQKVKGYTLALKPRWDMAKKCKMDVSEYDLV